MPHTVLNPPPEYANQYARLVDELQYEVRCAFCNDYFRANEIGMLGCSFHPMLTYARCNRGIPYTHVDRINHCKVCLDYHVPVEFRRKLSEWELSRRFDCTRVDHTSNPNVLFDHFLIGMPTFFASKLGIYSASGYHPSSLPNVLLVDDPEQLTRNVYYVISGMGLFKQSVRKVYDCMCERFLLDVLDDALFEARKGTKKTGSLSAAAGTEVAGAEERLELYNDERRTIEFVPFYIITRIEQRAGDLRIE